MRKFLTLLLIPVFNLPALPQATFEKTFGDIDDDEGYAVALCDDGTYILAGETENLYTGDPDVFLARIDGNGDTIWTRTFVVEYEYEHALDVLQSYDGGFVMTGYTYENDEPAPFLLKYDEDGNFLWYKTFGQQIPHGYGYALVEKPDSGLVICGRRDYYNAEWYHRPYLLETDKDGNLVWFKIYDTFTPYSTYQVYNMCLSADNHYILCGRFEEILVSPIDHAWLFEVDSNSNLGWDHFYGASDSTTFASDVKMTPDGGYIMCGSAYHGEIIFPGGDINIVLIKTDDEGNEAWRRTIGYDDREEGAYSIDITGDGGYILGGRTDYGATHDDIWLVRTDGSGDTLWTRSYGGPLNEGISEICPTPDGGFIFCGYTDSFGAGGSDIYLVKTNENGLLTGIREDDDGLSDVEVYPNPGNGCFHIRNCRDGFSCKVFSLDGKTVLESGPFRGAEVIVDISDHPPGIYILNMITQTSARTFKLIVNP